jgi:hypothetical protein
LACGSKGKGSFLLRNWGTCYKKGLELACGTLFLGLRHEVREVKTVFHFPLKRHTSTNLKKQVT